MNRAIISLLSLMIGTGITVVRDAFLGLSLFTSSKTSSNEIKVRLNFGLFTFNILFSTKTVFIWSSYFSMEAFTLFAHEFGVCSSIDGSLGIDRILIVLQK